MGLFGVVMLIVAVRLLLQKQGSDAMCVETTMRTVGRIDPETGRFQWSWGTACLLGGIGAMTGFLTGLLGVGGGFVIVPMLRRFTNVSMHGVVATSLMVIALVGTGGIVIAQAHGAQIPVDITLLFALATAMGMLAGRQLADHLSGRQVQRGFAAVLLVVATGLLAQAILDPVFG
ncbi:Sulfite exporter TauE/SafE [compost metagenome]